MDTSIIVALITGLVTIIATVLTVHQGNLNTQHTLEITNAVQNEKIEELTREVKRHNDFAERIPRIESRVDSLEKRVDRLEAR